MAKGERDGEMLTLADKGGGGRVREMLTLADKGGRESMYISIFG